jgi:aminoglycoside phosphotransferase (APT) family kinase protein
VVDELRGTRAPMMDQPFDDVKEALNRAYDIDVTRCSELHTGMVNVSYVTESHPRYVVRVTNGHSVENVAQEGALTERLRAVGFDRAPMFLRAKNGMFATQSSLGVLSVYEFIEGIVNQPLTDRQFSDLVDRLPNYLGAMKRLEPSSFPGRRTFTLSEASVQRGKRIYTEVAGLKDDVSLFDYKRWSGLQLDCRVSLIHSDLHAGNFVWNAGGTLLAMIDFERFCAGSQVIEVAALATGTCFDGTSLREDRLIDLLRSCSSTLQSSLIPFESFIDVCIFVGLYYFGRVNRHLVGSSGHEHPQLELRDLTRALVLRDNGDRLKSQLRRLANP